MSRIIFSFAPGNLRNAGHFFPMYPRGVATWRQRARPFWGVHQQTQCAGPNLTAQRFWPPHSGLPRVPVAILQVRPCCMQAITVWISDGNPILYTAFNCLEHNFWGSQRLYWSGRLNLQARNTWVAIPNLGDVGPWQAPGTHAKWR